jgi:hypothetical protein
MKVEPDSVLEELEQSSTTLIASFAHAPRNECFTWPHL